MNRSKARASKKEAARILKAHRRARNTPVIAFGSAHAMQGGASMDALRSFRNVIEEIIRGHGIKVEQPGEWGFDPKTRQFLSEYPIQIQEGPTAEDIARERRAEWAEHWDPER